VVKQNTIYCKHIIGLPIIDRDPIGIQLCHSIGASGIEGRGFALWNGLHQSIEFAGGSLVHFCFFRESQQANRLQYPQRADAIGIGRIFRFFETYLYVAHGREVINFVGLCFLDNANEVGAIGEVAVVEF